MGCKSEKQPARVAFLIYQHKNNSKGEIFMVNNKKETKLVFNYGVTRKLLAAGCTIVDIKPDRSNIETGKERAVHVFKNDEKFQAEFERLNREIAEFRASEEDDSE